MPPLPRISVRTRMTGRDSNEPHRASSPLELLFDLTFVVAVAQVASGLAHAIADGDFFSNGIVPYLTVFFAIWWAWINFTWFASAYDTDDVPYRLLSMLQMGGVLVLAAGVPAVFHDGNFLGITIGYVIMRVAAVAQWLRAAESPEGRVTAFRYAAGVIVVQIGWVARLLLPDDLGLASFVLLALAEIAVPVWAERPGLTPWHAQHIAERYSLFTIILLGESVSAATIAVQGIVTARGIHIELVFVAIAGLVLLFAMWWLYFMERPSEGLAARNDRVFLWGYGHYLLFAGVAAVGAALEVAVEEPHDLTSLAIGYALAVPVAVYLVMLAAVTTVLRVRLATPAPATVVAVVLVLLLPLAAPVLGVAGVVTGVALVVAALTAVSIAAASSAGARRGGSTPA